MKEDIGLTYAALGLVLAWEGRRRLGAGLAVGGRRVVGRRRLRRPARRSGRRRGGVRAALRRRAGRLVRRRRPLQRRAPVHDCRPSAHAERPRDPRDARPDDGRPVPARAALAARRRPGRGAQPALGLRPAAHDPVPLLDRRRGRRGRRGRGRSRTGRRIGSRDVARAGAAAAGVVLASSRSSGSVAIVPTDPRRMAATAPTARRSSTRSPPARASSAPMHALSHLAERKRLYVLPEPMIAVRVGVKDGVDRERARRASSSTSSSTRTMRFWGADDRPRRSSRARAPRLPRGHAARRHRPLPQGAGVVSPSAIALIGARAGSERVPGKNVRRARGPPAARLRDRDRPTVGGLRPHRRLHGQRANRPGGALVRRRRPVPPTRRVRDVDLARHRVDRLDAASPRGALRPVRDRPRHEPVPWAGRDPARARAAARDARGRLDQGRGARQAASREDVGARRGRPPDAAAPRPVAPRRRLARGPVPGPPARLRPEQRARDRLDTRRRGHRARARGGCSRRS